MWRVILAGLAFAAYAVGARAGDGASAYTTDDLAYACMGDKTLPTLSRVEACTALIARDEASEYPVFRTARGYAYLDAHEFKAALSDFSGAIAMDPSDAQSYFARAVGFGRVGDVKNMRADLKQGLLLEPADAHAYYLLGYLDVYEGKDDQAIVRFGQAIERDPAKRDAYFLRGFLYEERGAFDYALADYSRMLALDPDDGVALEARAAVSSKVRRNTAAATNGAERRTTEYEEYQRWLERTHQNGGFAASEPPSSSGWAGDAFRAPDAPNYKSNLRPPKYIPYTPQTTSPSTGTSHGRPAGTSAYDPMDTTYNPYETTDQARHGRGKKYDPFATFDSWQVDRSNPYARAPSYRGVASPFGVTPLKPPNVLGGTREQNNWETNRYDPFGTHRTNRYNPYAPARNGCPDRTSPTNSLNPYQPAC